ncbi:Catalase-peroxidase [Bienertia sinuspersici]
MASFSCSISSHFTPKLVCLNKFQPTYLPSPKFRVNARFQSIKNEATNSINASTTTPELELDIPDEDLLGIDNLHRFIQLNLGSWQFDAKGKLLHEVTTKLSAGSYGEDELISLIQTLYIKQPLSGTSFSGYEEKPEWAEYKIKESNMFTVDKYQQIGFFPNERAFALRYQTAGMLETVLRQGVLGEDDTGEESPRNLKLPSSRPSIVCENCLYSINKDMRARAFHIMDPRGVLEMLLIFLEERDGVVDAPPSLADSEDDMNRLSPFLGQWKGHSVTKRSGVYGATMSEHDTSASLEIDSNGQLVQDITSTTRGSDIVTNVRWTGAICDNMITFDKGFQFTLLPGGMYMGCPSDIAKSVAEFKSFHLEFCWLESSDKRQRLVRTFDIEGLAVSSTYFFETKM